jgi:hypothetical protein
MVSEMKGYYIFICPHCLNAVEDLEYEFQYADWRQKLKKKGKFRCPHVKSILIKGMLDRLM